jgi:hypothetical protein
MEAMLTNANGMPQYRLQERVVAALLVDRGRHLGYYTANGDSGAIQQVVASGGTGYLSRSIYSVPHDVMHCNQFIY